MQQYDPAQVELLLYEAGMTLMALRVPGCWPAGIRSGMPECAPDLESVQYSEPSYSAPQPGPRAVSLMDRVLRWVAQLPCGTAAEIRVKRLVFARMMVSPRTNKPLFSWRRLGEKAGISHVWAKTLWIQAVADLVAIANRPPAACAATFARIRAQGTAARINPASPFAAFAVRPLPGPCADTVRRIQAPGHALPDLKAAAARHLHRTAPKLEPVPA